jgi:peroxiredoxin
MRYLIPLFIITILLSTSSSLRAEKFNNDYSKYPQLQAIVEKSELKDSLVEALKDAGDNWESLAKALITVSGKQQEDLIWQITVMPHLDRLEATPEILLEHLEYAYKAKDAFAYKIPDDMFREYILVYRISIDEPVTQWRKMFFDRFRDMAGNTPSETAKNVNKWVMENIKVHKNVFFGPRQAPDQVLKNMRGTKVEIAILTTAILKALGVPARSAQCKYFGQQAGGANWVEIYDGGNWIPLYPDDASYFGDFKRFEKDKPHNLTVVATTSAFDALQITPNYTETGKLKIKVAMRGVVQKNFEHLGISAYNDGGWIPLDDLGFNLEEERLQTNEEDVFEAILGDGTYLVQAGARQGDGSVYFYAKEVEVKSGDDIALDIKLDPPINQMERKDLVARELAKLPEWELPIANGGGDLNSNSAYLSKFSVIAVFDINKEPSQRMIPLLADLKEYKDEKIKVWGIHAGPVDSEKLKTFIEVNRIDFPVTIDETGKTVEMFGIPRNTDKEDTVHFQNMPSIILLYKGEILLWRDGFDLGIRQFVIDMVDYQMQLPW